MMAEGAYFFQWAKYGDANYPAAHYFLNNRLRTHRVDSTGSTFGYDAAEFGHRLIVQQRVDPLQKFHGRPERFLPVFPVGVLVHGIPTVVAHFFKPKQQFHEFHEVYRPYDHVVVPRTVVIVEVHVKKFLPKSERITTDSAKFS